MRRLKLRIANLAIRMLNQRTTIQGSVQPVTTRRIGRRPTSITKWWEPQTANPATVAISLAITGVGSALHVITQTRGLMPGLIMVLLVLRIASLAIPATSLPTISAGNVHSVTTPPPGAGHPLITVSR